MVQYGNTYSKKMYRDGIHKHIEVGSVFAHEEVITLEEGRLSCRTVYRHACASHTSLLMTKTRGRRILVTKIDTTFKATALVLPGGIIPPCTVTDRWLSHQISSQLT